MTDKLPLNASVIHLIGLAAATTSMIVAGVLWADDIRSEMRVRSADHDARLATIEHQMRKIQIDHDVLIEIRTDLKQLRNSIEGHPVDRPTR